MGLDIFVMPLSGYLAGAFESPLAQVLTPEAAAQVVRVGTPKPENPPDLVAEHVRWVQQELSRLAGVPLAWTDRGETAFSHQFHYGLVQSIRALAASLDFPQLAVDAAGKPLQRVDATFEVNHPSLRHVYGGAPTRFPHLVWHADNQGFYAPVDFAAPVKLGLSPLEAEACDRREAKDRAFYETKQAERKTLSWKFKFALRWLEVHLFSSREDRGMMKLLDQVEDSFAAPPVPAPRWDWVGSSVALLRELEEIRPHLGDVREWNAVPGERVAEEADPLRGLKYAWAFLHKVARESVRHQLPIVFDG